MQPASDKIPISSEAMATSFAFFMFLTSSFIFSPPPIEINAGEYPRPAHVPASLKLQSAEDILKQRHLRK
ncbi:MAG TPA: hypothetical protein VKH64_01960 [Candidatus Binatia bacterium]|nr:hypothetical protein [Candidatus Binatia bacterium]